MIITNAQHHTFHGEAFVNATIDGETMTVPTDTTNRHYAEILKQVADGDITIAEAD